jgi:RNA recognition motif-containing protein
MLEGIYNASSLTNVALATGACIFSFLLGRYTKGGRKKVKVKKNGRCIEIYVGNLSYNVKESDLSKIFKKYGVVQNVRIITNLQTGKSKGFGFVEMPNRGEAQRAIENLDDKDIKGRKLVVNEAKSKAR